MDENSEINRRFRSLFENEQIQQFLHRHGLVNIQIFITKNSDRFLLDNRWRNTTWKRRYRKTFTTDR